VSETKTLDQFKEKFCVEELKVFEVGSWSWSVRPAQPTLGSGILSLNRYALRLSEVSPEEMFDLGELVGILEKTVKAAFNHNIMNYLMLMMVDHHVHYHVIPRYDGVRQFADLEWVDNGWPALPVIGDSQHENGSELLKAVQDSLKSTL